MSDDDVYYNVSTRTLKERLKIGEQNGKERIIGR
jgi:hypothetical protein